jgi:hypothetical protein
MSRCKYLPAIVLVLSFSVACGGGGDGPTLPAGKDSVSTVVGASGGVVTTPSGNAGAQIPAGALSGNVTITITRLDPPTAPGQGPLATTLNQYGPYYEIATSPPNAVIGDSIRVGVCQVTDPSSPFYPPESIHDRLRLAHTVGNTVEVLERADVNDFLRCVNVSADARESNPLKRLASRILSPRSAWAAHGGLGGKTKKFSPFGAVDPLTGLSVGPDIAIAASVDQDDLGSVAFDGVNYLVATETRKSGNVSSIAVQLVSSTGALVGSSIPIAAANNGGNPVVAFDGTNYLVVWTTFGTSPGIRGQFISKTGTLAGSAFVIVPTGQASPSALAFGGGTYFLAYTREAGVVNNEITHNTFGKIISTAGVAGPQLALSSVNTGDGFNNVAFDGTNFLTVYTDGSTIRGRFVSTAGVAATEKTILTGQFGELITVGWNGSNYLISAPKMASSLDAVVMLVSNAGNLVGTPTAIANVAGGDEFPVNVLPVGSDYLVTYIDSMSVAGRATTKARFVSSTGAARGPAFTIAPPAGGKVSVGWVAGGVGNKYFTILLRGIQSATTPADSETWGQLDVFGTILTVNVPP